MRLDSATFPGLSKKPESTFRIAALGDSIAEALQVDLDSTCGKQIENLLGTCEALRDSKLEVLNFGVSGFGTMQQVLTFRRVAVNYGPDLVLVAFFSGNDVGNNSRKLDPDTLRPFPVLEDGAIEAARPRRHRAGRGRFSPPR